MVQFGVILTSEYVKTRRMTRSTYS